MAHSFPLFRFASLRHRIHDGYSIVSDIFFSKYFHKIHGLISLLDLLNDSRSFIVYI